MEKVHAVVARSTFRSQNVDVEVLLGEWKKCTPLWREAHLEVKSGKTPGSSDDFWKLRCGKSARRCGAKHILK